MLNFAWFSTYNKIMHILPLPLCGLYSIHAQNGYGPYHPCKIVLLTLVAPRGVTDLHISWGTNIEHARTTYHKTCGTEYQEPCRGFNSQTPYFVLQMECSTSVPNERVWRITQLAKSKVEFQPPISRTHSWRFQFFGIRTFFCLWGKKPLHTGVRTGCH